MRSRNVYNYNYGQRQASAAQSQADTKNSFPIGDDGASIVAVSVIFPGLFLSSQVLGPGGYVGGQQTDRSITHFSLYSRLVVWPDFDPNPGVSGY